jgi:hypothetical protein
LLQKDTGSHALLRLQPNGFQFANARQPLALTLPLKSIGIRHTRWQLGYEVTSVHSRGKRVKLVTCKN